MTIAIDRPVVQFSPARLREARHAAGLTQRALGLAVDRTNTQVAYWERGTYVPTIEALCRLVQVLGVPVDALFEREAAGSAS